MNMPNSASGKSRARHLCAAHRSGTVRFTGKLGKSIALAVFGCALTPPAAAQSSPLDEPETLIEGPEAIGLRSGAFLFYPRVTGEAKYDSNIYNREEEKVGDALFALRPSVIARPDLTRHDLRLAAGAELRRYADTSAENSEQAYAQLTGRADLANRTSVSARALFASRIEKRGTFGDQFLTDKPIEFTEKEIGFGAARTGGILELSGAASLNKKTYSDATRGGTPIDLSFRDVQKLDASVQAVYQVGPAISAIAEVSGNRITYDEQLGAPRASSGWSALVGTRFDLGELASGEAAIGYYRQSFADPAEPSVSGVDYFASLQWSPLARLRLALSAVRNFQRSPLPEVSAVLSSTVRASARLALGNRNLLGVEVGLVDDDYRGIERKESEKFIELSLRHFLTPRLTAFGAAGYRRQDGKGVGARDFSGVTAGAGLTWAY